MDLPTMLASAGVSAVVSALVSLWAVRLVTVRRAKAERADAARQAVRAAVAPLQAELTRYEYARDRPEPKRTPQRSEMDDHTAVVRIRNAAADLPPLRRWLVDRRCRRVFGHYWTALAVDYPGGDPDNPNTLAAWLTGELQRSRGEAERLEGRMPTHGLMHRAYCELPGHLLLRRLRRELRRLAASS